MNRLATGLAPLDIENESPDTCVGYERLGKRTEALGWVSLTGHEIIQGFRDLANPEVSILPEVIVTFIDRRVHKA